MGRGVRILLVVSAFVIAVASLIVLDRRGLATLAPRVAEDTASASAAPTPAPTPTQSSSMTPPAPALLLPNMRSLRPSDLSIERVGDQRRLRFAASLANLGPGPMRVQPRGQTDCPSGQHPARQVVYRDGNADGSYQRAVDLPVQRRDAGCMLRHRGHDHWHFDAMAAYSLRRPGTDTALVARNKVSFCLRDNRRVPDQRVVVRRQHFGECSRTSQQGISPGWIDVYKADLKGQWLRIPDDVDDEVICLDLEADPRQRLTETNEADNATSVAVRINGTRVRRVNSDQCRSA